MKGDEELYRALKAGLGARFSGASHASIISETWVGAEKIDIL